MHVCQSRLEMSLGDHNCIPHEAVVAALPDLPRFYLNVASLGDGGRRLHSKGVAGGLLVKALDCRSKDPGFQSHL